MTENELRKAYFDWIVQLVYHEKYFRGQSYRKLLYHLSEVEFTYILDMDGNRAEDGVDLRYRFGYEQKMNQAMIASFLDHQPCSVLEMMVALALRCEEVMEDPERGNRTGQWFWTMVESLGLTAMNDRYFDETQVNRAVRYFLERDYKRNGDGGLFTVDNGHDLRRVEIWYQMCWYLNAVT